MVATGSSLPPALPDVGRLTYNTVDFDCLYTSTLSGRPVPDAAGRTFKGVEWTIAVEGVVTVLPTDNEVGDMDNRIDNIKRLLEQPAGYLIFQGKGLGDLIVNKPGPFNVRDLAWGPKPTLLDFKPLGGGLAALIKWQVVTLVPVHLALRKGPFLQFNDEVSISYDEEGYSQLSIRGVMEIPLTRKTVNDPTLDETVDTYRRQFMDRVRDTVNPLIYRVTQRSFNVSRDRRTMEWSYVAVENPPMPPPPDCLVARGTFSIRPQKQDPALFPWICSLRASYVVRKDQPRRTAWWAFIGMMNFRMNQADLPIPGIDKKTNAEQGNGNPPQAPANDPPEPLAIGAGFGWGIGLSKEAVKNAVKDGAVKKKNTLLIYFGVDEGLYLDSRTVSFEASWILMSRFTDVLLTSGLFRWPGDITGNVPWATSIQDISGATSWAENFLDPKTDVIVDYNLGTPGAQ